MKMSIFFQNAVFYEVMLCVSYLLSFFLFFYIFCSKTDTGSKHGDREDSAVSKGTTDSGVVVENRDVLVLPGDIPGILPPLSSGSFTTGYTEEVTKESEYLPLKTATYKPKKEKENIFFFQLMLQLYRSRTSQ